MKQQWKVEKEGKNWVLYSQPTLDDGTICGWGKIGTYKTRRFALTTGFILREKGERITWPGGALRMGIAMVDPC